MCNQRVAGAVSDKLGQNALSITRGFLSIDGRQRGGPREEDVCMQPATALC